MNATTVLCLAIATAAFAGPANAVFKCTTVKGVVYQDRPCREGSETDVRITIQTGEVMPKGSVNADEGTSANPSRSHDKTQSVKPVRYFGDGPTTGAKSVDRKTEAGVSDADGRRKETTPASIERTTQMTADQARNTEPSAKYYASESFNSGGETPMQMNCESPSGEKRMFYLSNGKLTSI